MITWLHYVPHSKVDAFKATGWTVSNDLSGTHHGKYSVIMIWQGAGEPSKTVFEAGA